MHGEYLHLKKHLEIAKSLKIEKTNLLLSGDLCQLDLVNKNHKLIDQFVIKKLPVVQNLIIEEDSFINERGKILHNGVVSINLILNKQFDIIKFQISDKGFPFSYNKEVIQDIELLSSQVERCNQILKRLSLNPIEEDDFIDEDLNFKKYINQIVNSFEETSNKKFILNFDQDASPRKIPKSIEIIYGLRNFIGNANKFAKEKIFITLKSNNEYTEITIEDDGEGYPGEILSKIGEPYLRLLKNKGKNQSGLGLGIFIGKNLLEKNFASLNCQNSKTRTGAEVNIKWKNQDLKKI